ncbi:MAG: AMP-binding protein, partial [Proteobacteria bacterium]|nr:AMP-binding protein [Pseudomonadota bacterium]
VWSLLRRNAQDYPDRVAVVDRSGETTFGDLLARSETFAAALGASGIVAGDTVSYQLPNCVEAMVVALAAMRIGAVALTLRERHVGRSFTSLDRFNEIEFARNWNLEGVAQGDEKLREATIAYSPLAPLSIKGSYGVLDRSGEIRSSRWNGQIGYQQEDQGALSYRVEMLDTKAISSNTASEWLRQSGYGLWMIGHFEPGLRIETEQRSDKPADRDSLRQGSFRFLEIAPKLDVVEFWNMSAGAEYQLRTEDSVASGSLLRASEALTQQYYWRLSEWKSLTAGVSLGLKRTTFTEDFRLRGNQNSDVLLIRFDSRYTPMERAVQLDTYYEFANQRSAPLERMFVRVQQGTGNFRYLGDLNGNGLPD